MYQIISDSACDFSPSEIEYSDIQTIPFYVSFDSKTYLKEEVDISKEEYFNRLINEKNLFPKTAQPNPQDYIDICTPHLESGKDILILTISSKLSGSYNSAAIAQRSLEDTYTDRKVAIIDSLTASIGQGLILGEIIKMRNEGYTLEETARIAKEVLNTTRTYVTLDSLEYVRRGGRIGPTTALVGGILGLKPILQLSDGIVTQLDNVRGKKNAMRILEEAMVHALKDDISDVNIRIGHIGRREDAESFVQKTEAALGTKIENPVTELGVTIGAHAGPGALGVSYCKKYDQFERKIA